ncbi:MAG: arsenical pump-driving ATPase [Bdellovibrionaceae bacterium]|nr:arsenical pump-driving ATPase [Pseudobdellovibrionaceae bacterium]
MKIHLVTGKGGVGKSAVAAALAYRCAQDGQKTLLAELGDESFYQDYLGLKPLREGQTVRSPLGFDVALWSGASCLREYALYLLKVESLYKLFFENPVSRTLIQVAPALSELAIMGKVTSGPPRNVGPKLDYDAIVVDAYATGHFLALLKAPIGMIEAVRVGPMAEQSKGILKILRDPQITNYHLVCLPEELPVQESLELDREIQALVNVKPYLWLNKLIDFPKSLKAQGPEYEKDFFLKQQRQDSTQATIEAAFKGRWSSLPFVFEADETKIVAALAKGVKR